MAQEIAAPIVLEEEARAPRPNRLRRALSLARQHPLGAFGLVCVILLFAAGIFADVIAPYDPLESSYVDREVGTLVEAVSAHNRRLSLLMAEWGVHP